MVQKQLAADACIHLDRPPGGARVIADATLLVDLARGDPGARAFVEAAETGSEPLRLASPAVARFLEGAARSRSPPREAARIVQLLLAAPEAPFASRHAARAADLLARAARAGVALDPFDAMTAAIAVEADEELVTRNARDYEGVPDLRVRTY